MTEENKGRLIGNANFTSISTAKRKKERKSTAPDDLGTDSIPFKQWPPPHHFLARFFDAPVSVNSGRGSAEHEEIEDDGLVYTRKGLLRPKAGEKLFVGLKETIDGIDLTQWQAANDARQKGTDEGGDPVPGGEKLYVDLGGNNMTYADYWMRFSEYEDFYSTFRVLSDAEVLDDEELNRDEVRRMRGETPLPRKPWGALRGSQGKPGLPKRVHTFDATAPIGLRVNLKSLKVNEVRAGSQASTVRTGWRLVEIDGEPTRSAKDLKRAIDKLCGDSKQVTTTWKFEVPSKGGDTSAIPPLSVISGQKVKLDDKCGQACKLTTCKHRPRIAFRLDSNRDYVDLHGRYKEPEPMYYPEPDSLERVKLDQTGNFPQTGQRIPLFGEAWEEADGAAVQIDTIKAVKFPPMAQDTETHGLLPDPKEPLRDLENAYKLAKAAVRKQNTRETTRLRKEIKGREAQLAKTESELATLKAAAEYKKSKEAEVEKATKEMEFYKKKAAQLQRQVRQSHQRARGVAPPAPAYVLSRRYEQESMDNESLPSYRTSNGDHSLPEYASNASLAPSEARIGRGENQLPPPPPTLDEVGKEMPQEQLESMNESKKPLEPASSGWWDRLHGIHANRLAKRDGMYEEGNAARARKEEALVEKRPKAPSWKEKENLNKVISKTDHLAREDLFNERRKKRQEGEIDNIYTETRNASGGSHAPKNEPCPDCGFHFRVEKKVSGRKLKKGMSVEARYFGTEIFYPATITSVRSTLNCDLVYDDNVLGPGKKIIETNVRRDHIREAASTRCMCHTRKSLGYHVAQINAFSGETSSRVAQESADVIGDADEVIAPTLSSSIDLSAATAYRGTGTVLEKQWATLEKMHAEKRRNSLRDATRPRDPDEDHLKDYNLFAERQKKWQQDRVQRAQDKRLQMDKEASRPKKHQFAKTVQQLRALEVARQALKVKDAAALAAKSTQAAVTLTQSMELPVDRIDIIGNKSGNSLRKSAQGRLEGMQMMEKRWEEKEMAKLEKQLLACGFARDHVRITIKSLWKRMDSETLGRSASGERRMTGKERRDAVENLLFDAMRILRRKQPSVSFVGAPVQIISSKSPAIAGSDSGTDMNDTDGGKADEDMATTEPDAPKVVGSGVVRSYDATKDRFLVVLTGSGKLVRVPSRLVRRIGTGRDPKSHARARSTSPEGKKNSVTEETIAEEYGVIGPGKSYKPSLDDFAEKVTNSRAISTTKMHVTVASKGRLAQLQKKKEKERLEALEQTRRAKIMAQRKRDLAANARKVLYGEKRNPDLFARMMGHLNGAEEDILDLNDFEVANKSETQAAANRVFEHFSAYIRKEHSRAIDVFKTFDKDGSGTLDGSEFASALERMGINASPEVAESVLKLADVNSDGKLEYWELMKALKPEPRAESLNAGDNDEGESDIDYDDDFDGDDDIAAEENENDKAEA